MSAPRLDERPDARPLKVEDLLAHARAGRIRVPRFQRPLRWKTPQVEALFDSMYRGFPVGSLLLWQRREGAATVSFGPVAMVTEERSDALLVVDGQQRVVSLVAAMMHPDQVPRGAPFAIWFDLKTEQFRCNSTGTVPETWIPLNVVGDSVTLSEWVDAWPYKHEQPELKSRAFLLGKRLREYDLPAYVVKTADEDALRLIFQRVNTAGIPLDENEVFDAIHGRAEAEKPLADMVHRLRDAGFGRIGEDDAFACYKAVHDIEPGHRAHEIDLPSEGDPLGACEGAIRRTFRFLVEDAGIPHMRLVPYGGPMVALARFFHLHPNPQPRTRSLLARWIWRGALSGQHAQTGNLAARRRWNSTIDGDEHGSVSRLLGEVVVSKPRLDPRSAWNERHAETKLLALVLLGLHPRSPSTGLPYTRDAIAAELDRYKPIKRTFVALFGPGGGIAARFVVLDEDDPEALFDVDVDIAMSHGIEPDAMDVFKRRDDAAVRLRADRLEREAEAFFTDRIQAHDHDRVAIAEIVRRVDMGTP